MANKFEAEKTEASVEIPGRITEMIKSRRAEYNNVNLSRERWVELNDEHKRMMEGNSEDDLYYQLAVLRDITPQGDDPVRIQIGIIEDELRKRKNK